MGIFAIIRAVLELLGFASREVHDAEQRKAGSDASQVKATNDEIDRVNRAADAGSKLPNIPADSNNLDK